LPVNGPLAEVFRYNRWATLSLLEACRTLSDEHLDARVAGTSGTVRELLMHVVGGQQALVLRTMGRQHEGELNRSSEWPGFEALIDAARRTSDQLIEIAEGLVEDAEVAPPTASGYSASPSASSWPTPRSMASSTARRSS
jgi:uncharacterized damage-inducible protein DinB